MSASAYTLLAAWNIGDYSFRTTTCLQISILVRKAHNRIRIANVNIFRIGPWRIKSNAKWSSKSGRKSFGCLGFSVGSNAAEQQYAPGPAFCHKQIAIGRGANQS